MRDRHATWRGLRWTLRRQAGFGPPDENAAAYGEVVWSWRRDPGATPARDYRAGNGGKKGRSPGRARISRKPLRGESRDVSAVPVKPVCVLYYPCTRRCGRSRRPAFPAPSVRERDKELASLGRKRAARTRSHVFRAARLPRLHRIRQRLAGKERLEIGDHAVLHRHMRFQRVAADMRGQHDVRQRGQRIRRCGSLAKTSRPAPAMVLSVSAATSACWSMTEPRAMLMTWPSSPSRRRISALTM